MHSRWLRPWLLLLALLIGLAPASPATAQDGEISVNIVGGSRDYLIAVQRFASDAASRNQVEALYAEIVAAIELSGGFRMVPDDAFLDPLQTANLQATRIPCDNWRAVGTDALLEGRVEQVGGVQRIRYRVWDTARCQQQGDPAFFEVSRDDLWIAARKLADDVIYRFTGRRGIAATQIAFVSNQEGNKEIFVMESDGTRRQRVTSNGSVNLFPGWSRDGRSLIYTSHRAGLSDLWMLARAKKGRRVFDLRRLPGEKYRGIFGPSDRDITFVMHVAENTDLYRARADGDGKPERLTRHRAIDVSPSWSPDRKRIAFASDRAGTLQIYVKDMETGLLRRLTFEGKYNASPAWSPDGRWIAYAARTGHYFDIYLADPETGDVVQLTEHPRNEEAPAWSPDSRKIVFVSDRFGRKDLFSIDLTGRGLRRLTEGFGDCSGPTWSSWLE